ncbi:MULTISPECIES: hypothetical protein [unclassified Novosphingobium]|uniref:hypothetical protein n=1 Tax=unclassified Novosphingobium TaxID=2644732 RepID=UPI0025EAA8D1|nr:MULTISPECIES: hypothetical protein [unclassified Novosphingobium]HQV02791.1 hypothetical protein [Novosphingobium sp.]
MNTTRKHYRYYDTLIDIAFWSFLIQSIIPWLRLLGLTDSQLHGVWSTVSMSLFIGTWLLIEFLILAGFMRDEYAQGLWQRAGAKIVKLLTTALPLIFLAAVIFQDQIVDWLRTQAPDAIPSDVGTPQEAAILAHASGALKVIFYTAVYLPFVFICLYKWQRWRDA